MCPYKQKKNGQTLKTNDEGNTLRQEQPKKHSQREQKREKDLKRMKTGTIKEEKSQSNKQA